MNLYNFIVILMSLGQTQQPSGAYCGTKSVFGDSITGLVTFRSSSILDFALSGDFNIDCTDESYSISGNQIIFTDINMPGDCTHDALNDNQIVLNSITYDTTKNTIDVSVKYSIAKIDILLTQC